MEADNINTQKNPFICSEVFTDALTGYPKYETGFSFNFATTRDPHTGKVTPVSKTRDLCRNAMCIAANGQNLKTLGISAPAIVERIRSLMTPIARSARPLAAGSKPAVDVVTMGC